MNKKIVYILLLITIFLIFLSPYASELPDGLDWTINKTNITYEETKDYYFNKYFIFSDYKVPFIDNEKLSTIAAGFSGIILILIIFKIYKFIIFKKQNTMQS